MKVAADQTFDFTAAPALPLTSVSVTSGAIVVDVGGVATGAMVEIDVSSFDTVNGINLRIRSFTTPSRVGAPVALPSSTTVTGFDAACDLPTSPPPSGQVRVHAGAAPAAIVRVLLDGPRGSDDGIVVRSTSGPF